MNILFCNFDEEWHKDVIGKTVRDIGAENVVAITLRPHDLSEYTENYCWIPNDDFNQKRYEFMKDKVLPPLDTKLLEELKWCESLYYPMLDRLELETLKTVTYHQRKKYYENDDYYYDGHTGWFGWEEGIYSDPKYGQEGTLTLTFYPSWYISAYDPIGTITVNIGP